MNDLLTNLPIGQLTDLLNSIIDQMADFLTDNSKRVGVVDPGGVANLYGLWDWVGMAPCMGPDRDPFVHISSGLACVQKSQW